MVITLINVIDYLPSEISVEVESLICMAKLCDYDVRLSLPIKSIRNREGGISLIIQTYVINKDINLLYFLDISFDENLNEIVDIVVRTIRYDRFDRQEKEIARGLNVETIQALNRIL